MQSNSAYIADDWKDAFTKEKYWSEHQNENMAWGEEK